MECPYSSWDSIMVAEVLRSNFIGWEIPVFL